MYLCLKWQSDNLVHDLAHCFYEKDNNSVFYEKVIEFFCVGPADSCLYG